MCYRYLEIARRYANDLLATYMFRDKRDGKQLADDISEKLVYSYPEHGFAICCSEAEHLGLNVMRANQTPTWNDVWKIYLRLSGTKGKTLVFLDRKRLDEALRPS
jgi:hypothetical protein